MSQQLRSATDGPTDATDTPGAAGSASLTAAAGERFARALAAKNAAALRAILADPIDFRALTPGRQWEASTPGEVVDDIVLGAWFEPGDHISDLESVGTCELPGRGHVSYRLRVRSDGVDYVVEQQAYYDTAGEQITWMRVLCSGYRPLVGTP